MEWQISINMRKSLLHAKHCLLTVLLLFSCHFERNGANELLRPEEVEMTPEITEIMANQDLGIIDIREMKLYVLKDYYIAKSVLCGPTGRGSNYFYYLLYDNSFSKSMLFMSLSGEINNIGLIGDTLFVDMLDFIDDVYYNGEYFQFDSCDFVCIHTKQLLSSFKLDTVSIDTVICDWGDVSEYSSGLQIPPKVSIGSATQ